MTQYKIIFRDGPLDQKMAVIDLNIKPGDLFVIGRYTYQLLDSVTAQLNYKDGSLSENLACGAIYINPELN